MPAATTRTALLAVTEKEYAKLAGLCNGLHATDALHTSADGMSIKDLIGHRAHWIDLFLGWYRDGQAGQEVFFPAKGYKWNQLNDYNAALRKSQADLSWAQVLRTLEENHQSLVALITARSQDQLYGGPMKGAKNHWTTGRWAEAAGPSHYRSAAKYIRACLKQSQSG